MYPEHQQRLFDEIKTVLPDVNSKITRESVQSMPFLDMIVKETLRLFPAVPFLTRTTTSEVILGKKLGFFSFAK